MLTSSDAKWRCMWHMMVWSILLTLVSQFLVLTDHVAFYIFSALCMLVLPILTAVYSNTSGRRGAGLIRVAYVICDPVLACISLTPVLLLNHLPGIVNTYSCLVQSDTRNQTCSCLVNRSAATGIDCGELAGFNDGEREKLIDDTSGQFVVVQMSVAVPILVSLLMGRRTIKMSFYTYILLFAYWFVVAIESVAMLETIRLGDVYRDVIYTTMAIVSISLILTNSYAVVTLCSFISPQAGHGRKQMKKQFDFIYRVFVGCSAILFTEIPLIVARFQILAADISRLLPATFYLWFIKDFVFLSLIIVIILGQKLNERYFAKLLPCKVNFDNTDIVFQPEKRDAYIERKKCVRFQDPPATTFGEESQILAQKVRKADRSLKKVEPSLKVPSSVLKSSNSSQSISSNNNKDYGTTGKKPAVMLLPGNEIDSRHGSLASIHDDLLCLPITDSASDSLNDPHLVSGGTRSKMCKVDINSSLVREIKATSDSDTESGNEAVV